MSKYVPADIFFAQCLSTIGNPPRKKFINEFSQRGADLNLNLLLSNLYKSTAFSFPPKYSVMATSFFQFSNTTTSSISLGLVEIIVLTINFS
jgi:hypothetical protein